MASVFTKRYKNSLLIHYNTSEEIYIMLYYFVDSKLTKTFKLPMTRDDLNGICPNNDTKIMDFIKANIPDYSHIFVIISTKMTFKTTTVIKNDEKGNKNLLYLADIKALVPDYKDKFNIITSIYKGHESSIYYTYYIPLDLTAYFTKIARTLGANLEGIDQFAHYIFNLMKNKKKDEDFILHYSNDVFSMLIISYDGAFTSYATCTDDSQDVKDKYCIYYTKHEIELEKKRIDNFYSNKKELIDFSNDVKEIKIEYTDELFNGINLS